MSFALLGLAAEGIEIADPDLAPASAEERISALLRG